MKLFALLNVAVMGAEKNNGPRRPRLIMEQSAALGRSIPPERFIYQWPQCENMTCGKNSQEVQEALEEGCLIRPDGKDYIQADRGSIKYPTEGKYENYRQCIWQVRPKSPNKFIKFRVTKMDSEYDQYCGMDKLHIYNSGPKKFGGKDNEFDSRIARICGGDTGPKYQQSSFTDAVGKLQRFSDNTCPARASGKRKKCKIEGHDTFFEIESDIMTVVFETDQSDNDHTGFILEWETYPRPDPTPPPPADIDYTFMAKWISQKMTNKNWGIFAHTKNFVQCPRHIKQAKQCHNRYKQHKAQEARNHFVNIARQLSYTQNYHPRGCAANRLVPQSMADRRDELKQMSNREANTFQQSLEFWFNVQAWRLEKCNNSYQDLKNTRRGMNRIMELVFQRRNVFSLDF